MTNLSDIRDRASLQAYMSAGNPVKFLFFWGHRPHPDRITKSCLSQWWLAEFTVDGITYESAEQYMMAEKARLFGDEAMLARILAAGSPAEAKKLGRLIANFDEATWERRRFEIVVDASVAKFGQNEPEGNFLRNTQGRVLVEASPQDRIWGIGMDERNRAAANPEQWRGDNLLGFALMEARQRLSQTH